MTKHIITAVLIAVGVYLFGAFVAWDFNAGNWSKVDRIAIGFMLAVAVIGLLMEVGRYDH